MPKFDDPTLGIKENIRLSYLTHLDKSTIPQSIHKWLQNRGFSIHSVECFFSSPYTIQAIHHDTRTLSDVVKINWVFGGQGSFMAWYKPTPGIQLVTKNDMGVQYAKLEKENATEVFRAYMGEQASLVNVGRFHGVTNQTPYERFCYSAVIVNDGRRVLWSEAVSALIGSGKEGK